MDGSYDVELIRSPAPVWKDWECWWHSSDGSVSVARDAIYNMDVEYAIYDDRSAHQYAMDIDMGCGFDLKGAERAVRSFGRKFMVPKQTRDRLLHVLADEHGEAVAKANRDRLNGKLKEERDEVVAKFKAFLAGFPETLRGMGQDELEDMSCGSWTWNMLEGMFGWHLFNEARDCGIFPERYVAERMVSAARREVRRRKREKLWKKESK